jgi:hypothetical protein
MQILSDAWAMIVGWWGGLASYWGWAHYLIIALSTMLTGVAARIGYRVYWYSKSRKLIRRVLISQDGSARDVARKMRLMAEADAATWFMSRRNPLAMARRLVELEIINPSEPKPNRDDYDPDAYREELKNWQEQENERTRKLVIDLRRIFLEAPRDFEKDWNIRTICRAVARFLGRMLGKKNQSAGKSDPPPASELAPTLQSFADLDSRRASIERYFRVLTDIRPDEPRLFSTEVSINNGFLAPIFLITGILNRFDEERGWKLIIDEYRELVRHDDFYSPQTRELRAFLFNCWLLWGPSIPQCDCGCWASRHDAYQYGYGDENQSIDLFVRHGSGPNLSRRLNIQAGPKYLARLAAPYKVRGRFRLGADLKDDEVCQIQRRIIAGGGDALDTSEGRIILECSPESFEAIEDGVSSNYYSAYLWIIFVLLDKDGRPYFGGEERWKNVLCFFEHGNIADASTYQTSKQSLAIKAVSAISEILERDKYIRIKYACALDDSNCSSGLRYRPDSNVLRIVDVARSHIDGGNFPAAKDALASGILLIPAREEACERDSTYSSCALPDLVADFYRQLNHLYLERQNAVATKKA